MKWSQMIPGVCKPLFIMAGILFVGVVQAEAKTVSSKISPLVTIKELRRIGQYDFSILTTKMIAATAKLPEHLVLTGLIQPEIRFAMKLPSQWNGRFYMAGNGGYAGNISYREMDAGLMNGYATASTDTGHDAEVHPLGSFAFNEEQKTVDYAFRAVHLTAVTAKTVIEAYYGSKPAYSYWVGCSTGGRQGLMEAQRFPMDFDGIVAGAPVLDFTGTQLSGIWDSQALLEAPISPQKLPLLASAVLKNCDAEDGIVDGLIEDPRQCSFDPTKHLPRCLVDADDSDCFTVAQSLTLKKMYDGVKNSKGQQLFPGLPLGAEIVSATPEYLGGGVKSGWEGWIIGSPSLEFLFADTFLRYMAFKKDDPNYDWKAFDFDTDPAKMTYISSIMDATDPDLSAFQKRGGKLLQYHGWADAALNPMMTINYYEDVLRTMGAHTTEFYKLYMVPGLSHCVGGNGPGDVDWFLPLVNWVENDEAPQEIIGSHSVNGEVDLTRPLCSFPKTIRYNGEGNVNTATSFSCVQPQ